jgi:hypothetical protein
VYTRLALGYWLTAAVSALLLVIYALYGLFPDSVALFTDYATPLISGVAALIAILATLKYGATLRTRFSGAWLLFAIGMTAWFVAELIWAVYVLVLNVPIPFPSIADPFYVAGYFSFFGGLVIYANLFSAAITRKRFTITSAVVAVGTLLVAWFLLAPVLASNSDSMTKALDVLYPILDVLILGGAVLGLAIFAGGRLGRAWAVLIAAIVVDVLADIAFAYMDAQGTYYSGSVSDFLYLWSYALFALAFYVHRGEL